jgi:hypothetical protein
VLDVAGIYFNAFEVIRDAGPGNPAWKSRSDFFAAMMLLACSERATEINAHIMCITLLRSVAYAVESGDGWRIGAGAWGALGPFDG